MYALVLFGTLVWILMLCLLFYLEIRLIEKLGHDLDEWMGITKLKGGENHENT